MEVSTTAMAACGQGRQRRRPLLLLRSSGGDRGSVCGVLGTGGLLLGCGLLFLCATASAAAAAAGAGAAVPSPPAAAAFLSPHFASARVGGAGACTNRSSRQRRHGGLGMMAPPPGASAAVAAATVAGVVEEEGTEAPTRQRVALNAIDINRRGEEGIPVLVLHGLLGSGRNFRSWASTLHDRLARPRRVLVPDLRNHGSSPHVRPEEGGMSYREMASDIFALLDQHGVEKAVVVGHSMGGKVAAAAALSTPERVAGLVVMDIAPVTYSITDGTNWQDTHKVIEMLSALPLEECADKAAADQRLQAMGLTDPGMRAFALTNLLAPPEGGVRWQINLEGIRRSLPQIAAFDVGSIDEEDAGPKDACEAVYPHKTLFMNGGNSKYLRTGHLSTISQLFPTFSLATIRGAGHWVHAEKPEETLQMVQRYLDEEMDI